MGMGKRTILVVDDEQSVRDLFASTLAQSGFDIVTVADPDEGIETAKRIEPDIIYISLLFPGSNGLKVGKSLHSVEQLKETPIVVLISYEGELDPKYTRTIGIVDVLVKPLKPSDVVAMTAKLLGEEISSGGHEPAGISGEAVEVSPPAADAELLSAETRSGDPAEGRGFLHMGESSEEDVSTVEEEDEDESAPPDWLTEPVGEEAGSSMDFSAGGEEGGEREVSPVGPSEEEENDAGSAPVERENSLGYVEDQVYKDEEPFEAAPESEKRSAMKYVIFAALVLLVAVAVFAAFQAGIFPGGSGLHKLLPVAAKETPVRKETVREAVQPGNIEGGDKVEDVQARKNSRQPAKALSASSSSAERKEKTGVARAMKAPAGETKVLNEGLKEPRTLKGQQKQIYSVQVGAFGKEGNAVSFTEKLKKRGYDAFVEKGSGAGLHRVLIGRFDDYKKALRQSEVLLQEDGIKSVIYRH